MSSQNNQPDNVPRYQPPNYYTTTNNPPEQVVYAWPTSGEANASDGVNILPPIIPNPPDSMPYLIPPNLDPQAELYRRAVKRAEARLHFYKHLRSYIIVNVILWGIAIISSLGYWGWSNRLEHWSFWAVCWPLWVTLFWGIGLVSEYVSVFVMNDQRKQEMIEAEMRRLRR